MKKIKKALISVSDKKNLRFILKYLKKYNIKIISSGGTFNEIKKLGFKCTEVSDFTKSPEILDGRVKTLHPKIHAGILSKRNKKSHVKELKKNKFEEIDLVIVNFYPFEKVLQKTKNHSKIIENIDIGGPAMVRAAAKNYESVSVITNINQYLDFVDEIKKHNGSTSLKFRQKMSEQAFMQTAYYDAVISNYYNKLLQNKFPKIKLIYGKKIENLRYGENPHQEAAIYSNKYKFQFKQLSGKKLSYNNYNDMLSAVTISKSLPKSKGTVIVKHGNPCGISIKKNKIESFKFALKSDPISAFGGIVSCNFKIKKNLAILLGKIFFEVIIANGFDKDALKILKRKKNLRIIDANEVSFEDTQSILSSLNSILIQSTDLKILNRKDFKIVSKNKPNKETMDNLIFAFNICKFVKSNAIVLTKNYSTVGIGSGQPSRLDSCKIAIEKMRKFNNEENDKPIFAASDAFFPFVDGFEKLVQAGVSAIVQPYGSIRDKEIIKFANQTGTILVFSKTRHFRH